MSNERRMLAEKATQCYDIDGNKTILEKIKSKSFSDFGVIFYPSLFDTDVKKEWFDKIYFEDNPTMKESCYITTAITFQNKIFIVVVFEKKIEPNQNKIEKDSEYSPLCQLVPVKFTTFLFLDHNSIQKEIQAAVPTFCFQIMSEMQKSINKISSHEVLIEEEQIDETETNTFEERNGDYICDHCLASGDNIVIHDNLIECYVCGNIKDLD